MADVDTSIIVVCVAVVSCIGGLIARDRQLTSMINNGDKVIRDELDKKTDVLHDRINSVKDQFVRRDDLNSYMTRIEDSINQLRTDQKILLKRVDTFLLAMTNGNKHRE